MVGDARALDSLEPWEVCVLVGLAVVRGAQEGVGVRWPERLTNALERSWAALLPPGSAPTMQVGKLVSTLGVLVSTAAGTGAVLSEAVKVVSAVRWDRRIGRRQSRPTDQDPRVRAVIDAVHAILEAAARLTGKRVLVLLDGLDRVRDPSCASGLCIESALLAQLPCAVVATAPFVMRFDTALHTVRGFEKHILVNEPVLDRAHPTDPARLGVGLAFFERLFESRTQIGSIRGDSAPSRAALWLRRAPARLPHRHHNRLAAVSSSSNTSMQAIAHGHSAVVIRRGGAAPACIWVMSPTTPPLSCAISRRHETSTGPGRSRGAGVVWVRTAGTCNRTKGPVRSRWRTARR